MYNCIVWYGKTSSASGNVPIYATAEAGSPSNQAPKSQWRQGNLAPRYDSHDEHFVVVKATERGYSIRIGPSAMRERMASSPPSSRITYSIHHVAPAAATERIMARSSSMSSPRGPPPSATSNGVFTVRSRVMSAINGGTSLVDPKPELTLYANDQQESLVAFTAIEKARIRFQVIPACEQPHPSVVWGGDTFTGLDEIMALTEFLLEIDARLDAAIARQAIPLLATSDLRVKQAAEEGYQQYLTAAQAVMASLQKPRGSLDWHWIKEYGCADW